MANNIIISYDLCQSGQNYDDVIKYIQSYTVYCKINQSVWYVKTDKTPIQVRDELTKYLDDNDLIFVAACDNTACWKLPNNISRFLKLNWN